MGIHFMLRWYSHTAWLSVFCWGIGVCCLPSASYGQSKRVSWQLISGSESTELSQYKSLPLDSLQAITRRVLNSKRKSGYYFTQLDSTQISDTTASPIRVRFFVDPGPRVNIGRLDFSGVEVLAEETITDLMTTRLGRVLDESVLEEDIDRVLRFYEAEGYAFARMSIDSVRVEYIDEKPSLAVALNVIEGERVRVNDIVLAGAKRTRLAYVEQVTGLRKGEWLNQDLAEVYRSLQASLLFQRIDPPRLVRIGDEDVVIQISVEEDDPGTFDLVMGYQPPAAGGASGGLVGNGHLELRNMFGRGRRVGLKLNRLPGQISQVEAHFADPFLFRLPLSVEAGFQGLQQDSTYGQQAYRGAIGYILPGGLGTFFTVSREVTKPGQAGLQLRNGQQRIPQSDIVFAGVTVRFSRLDRPVNPRQGIVVETRFERGRRNRTNFEQSLEGDTTRVRSVSRQERLTVLARGFFPTFKQQVFAIGNETRILASEEFDASDLFRLGGAQSLRGYDEDRFRGRLISRSFVEYRYLFERRSYAYLFFDLGYVDRPATPEGDKQRDLYPGYGFGTQFETGVGLINTSIALAGGDNPSQAKVHVGLSVGL